MTLDKLINGLERFQRSLDNRITHKLLDKLGEFGVEYAKSQVVNIDTGATRDSIEYHIEGNKLIIEAGGNAVWLEFGTGVARNPSPYPGELPDGIVGHGEYGKGNGANPNGWYYPTDNPNLAVFDKETGEYWQLPDSTFLAHTMGIEANMFMYKTSLEIEKKASEYGLEIISAELKYD